MLENLFQSSQYGQYLQEGAAQSYDELQKRIIYVNSQMQQQQIAAGLAEKNYQAVQAANAARAAAIARQTQANYTIQDYNVQRQSLNDLKDMTNQIYAQTNNAYNASISNMTSGLRTIANNTYEEIQRGVGQIRSSYGASDIVVDTGSSKDISQMTAQATENKGNADYASMAINISNAVSKRAAAALTNAYQNMNADTQQQLLEISVNRALNG